MRGTPFFKSLVIIAILIYPFLNLAAQEEVRNDILDLGKSALLDYQNKNYDEAIVKFNKFLLAQPSDKEALYLRREAGIDKMLKMLMKGGEISRIARAILLYAERAPIRQVKDNKVIKKYVDLAATGNLYERNEATALLEAQIGERAVPYMLEYLANKTKDAERVNIILTITKIGKTLVMPLIQALNSSDSFLKQQIVILLGHLGDERALADIKRIIEDPKELPEVKRYAKTAIKQIAKKSSIALPPAKELYFQKALKYYKDDPSYKPILAFNWLYWKWQDEKLVSKTIPIFMYNEIMAEEACYKALELDATYNKVWALLVRVYYGQFSEIQAVKAAKKTLKLPKEELERFYSEEPLALKAKRLASASGPKVLYKALENALTENRPEVTIKVLENIGEESRNRGELPQALLKALRNKDKRIRYAAAESIVKINPIRPFSESHRVIETLKQAMGEWDARVVLVIDDNDENRNKIVDIIRDNNMVAFSSVSGLEGLEKAKLFPPEDLIIVSSQLKDLSTTYLINSLREDYRSKDIPILLICPEKEKEKNKELYKDVKQFKGVLGTPFLEASCKTLIKNSLKISEVDYKAKAREIAKRAVAALAMIPANNRAFNLKNAIDALGDIILTRHDSIRGPAIEVLGKLGAKKVVPALIQVISDKEVALDIRLKSAWALGEIFNKTKIRLSKDDLKRIVAILQEKAPQENTELQKKLDELHNKVYYVVGQANVSPEDRRQVFVDYRIHSKIEVKEEKVEEKVEKVEKVEKEPVKDTKKPKEETVDWGEETGGDEWGSETEKEKDGEW